MSIVRLIPRVTAQPVLVTRAMSSVGTSFKVSQRNFVFRVVCILDKSSHTDSDDPRTIYISQGKQDETSTGKQIVHHKYDKNLSSFHLVEWYGC